MKLSERYKDVVNGTAQRGFGRRDYQQCLLETMERNKCSWDQAIEFVDQEMERLERRVLHGTATAEPIGVLSAQDLP